MNCFMFFLLTRLGGFLFHYFLGRKIWLAGYVPAIFYFAISCLNRTINP